MQVSIIGAPQGPRVEASFVAGDACTTVFFENPEGLLVAAAESAIAAALLPAMRIGEPVDLAIPFSTRLSRAIPTLQDIFHRWDPALSKISVRSPSTAAESSSGGHRVGTFFSGGMDSFYTFLKHSDQITDLIFVHGYDISLEKSDLRERTSRAIREIALAYGKGLVEVTTDVRPWLDRHVPWAFGHGSMMAAVGHLLSRHFSRIYIPSSHSYADLFPWGSHPLVDPLWSSERVEFVHDGCEATRIEKADLIARSDAALRTLRVCWRNRRGAYNCGICEKCIRTMLNLAAAGALDRCTTFPEPLTPSTVEDVVLRDTNERSYAMENLHALEERQRHPELAAALRRLLHRSSVGTRMRHYRRRLRRRYPSLWPKAWE